MSRYNINPFTQDECQLWTKTVTVNPRTKRKIGVGKSVYNTLSQQCEKHTNPLTEEECQMWLRDPKVSPRTKRRIRRGTMIYNDIATQCAGYKADVGAEDMKKVKVSAEDLKKADVGAEDLKKVEVSAEDLKKVDVEIEKITKRITEIDNKIKTYQAQLKPDLYSSGLVGMPYVESFLPMLYKERVFQYKASDYNFRESQAGKGTYGDVLIGDRKSDGKTVAIKRIVRSQTKLLGYLPLEYVIVRSLNHPNIMKFHEIRRDSNYFYMIGDYYPDGNLIQHIMSKCPNYGCPPDKFKHYARQMVEAISYCHQRGIIHADIKPDNMVLNGDTVYLIDFGFAITQDKGQLVQFSRGTKRFSAPEVILDNAPFDGTKSDIWALGVSLYMIMYNHFPFYDNDDAALSDKILNKEPLYKSRSDYHDEDCVKLIKMLLMKNPAKRLPLKDVLKSKCLS